MSRLILLSLLVLAPLLSLAQDDYGFPFGRIAHADFEPTVYANDTSASAYVIREFGEAHIDHENPNRILFTYHVKLRILKQRSLDKANIEITLRKSEGREEVIRNVKASAFNLSGKTIKETKLEQRSIFTEKNSKNSNVVKFAIPGATIGSVLEYEYLVETPYIFNFKEWEFQNDLPKMLSEYWTVIPANYVYNITLRGYLKLSVNTSEIQKACLTGGYGASADCVSSKYAIRNVPAFVEEEYMTAKENFLSSIKFELSEVKDFRGRVDKYTKEWKDVDLEMKTDPNFGMQLKKGKDVVAATVDAAVSGESDLHLKAKKVYDLVKFRYTWNGYYGAHTELGIKKAFEEKKGNVGDINLTLIAALRYAGFDVEPVLIATRGKGRPVELHPVLSDFNYVIGKLNLDSKVYLLDAVDDFLPFGSISMTCYNGKGRVLAEAGSYWMDIKPTDRDRTVTQINLVLSKEGVATGTIVETNFGYAGITKRKEISDFRDEKEYVDKVKSVNHFMTITNYERTLDEDLSKPVVEKYTIEFSAFDAGTDHFLFNPFIVGKLKANPFKSSERLFPVDFGVSTEDNVLVSLEFPDTFEVTSFPERVGILLPNSGGRYLYSAQVDGNKLTVNDILSLSRPIYTPQEYPYLKEIYNKMLQTQGADVIFQKKK